MMVGSGGDLRTAGNLILWMVIWSMFPPYIHTLQTLPPGSTASIRLQHTDRPYIEDVLDRYAHLSNVTSLALGSSHWNPPYKALEAITPDLIARSTHRYGTSSH